MATEATLRQPSALDLPAPKVRKSATTPTGLVVWQQPPPPAPGSLVPVSSESDIEIVVLDVPEELFEPQYGLLVELLRYRSNNPSYLVGAVRRKVRGYVHPSNQPAPSGNGFATRGGNHDGVQPPLAALRQTEWAATSHGQRFSVLQSMLAFMKIREFYYRDSGGGTNSLLGIMPWNSFTSGGSSTASFGSRFPYTRHFTPGYFAFRFSYLDPQTGYRVHGPRSEVVSLSSEQFPLLPDTPFLGLPTATVHPFYNPYLIDTWIGRVSRLP